MARKSIWDAAGREAKAKDGDRGQPLDRVLFMMGNKNSGKTTLLSRFLERSDERKATAGLEYTYLRKSSASSMGKDVAHIWELGGGTSLADLIDVVIKPNNISRMAVALVLDLSQPNEIWTTYEELMTKLKATVKDVCAELKEQREKQILDTLQNNAWAKFGKNHPDAEILTPLKIPIAFIGSKYDIFRKEIEPERQRVICITLRFLAHLHGASLMFCTNSSESLVLRSKALLSALAFGTVPSKVVVLDPDKPCIVPAGKDSLGAIGPPPIPDSSTKLSGKKPVDMWKSAYTAFFPQTVTASDPGADSYIIDPQFAEPVVDDMRKQKDQELVKYKKATEKAAKEQERQAQASGQAPARKKSTSSSSSSSTAAASGGGGVGMAPAAASPRAPQPSPAGVKPPQQQSRLLSRPPSGRPGGRLPR